jgi:tungstate transport system substrate-binding protein
MRLLSKSSLIILFWMLPSLLAAEGSLRLATTTSVENSRFLDFLLPAFQKETGIPVDVIAVGTGAALALGRKGDVDALLVHDPDGEIRFMQEGYGVSRTTFMYNDFLLVGPESDPAGVRSASTIHQCFTRIGRARVPFLSRGDSSGTHLKEKEIWNKAGVLPQGSWYKEGGQGMEALLRMASEMKAYTLTDSATWAFLQEKISLKALYRNQNESILKNFYSLILVNPERFPPVAFSKARAFLEWINSPEGRQKIQSYTIRGEQVFFLQRQP